MNLDHVKEFITIADSPSMRQAAAILGISTATLSARMKAFENELGVTLFSRENNSITLSPEGMRFLVDAREIHIEYSEITRQLHLLRQESSAEQLRIGVTGSYIPPHLGPFLDIYTRQHPRTQITLLDDTAYGIEEGIINEMIDVYFSPCPVFTSYQTLAKYTISACNPRILLPKEHPLATHPYLTLQDLDQETFLLYPVTKVNYVREYQLNCLEQSNIRYSISSDVYSLNMYRFLIPMGKGVFIDPFPTSDLPPQSISISLRGIHEKLSYCVFYKKFDTPAHVNYFLEEYEKFANRHV